MKKHFTQWIFVGLFLSLFGPNAFSQGGIGITNGEKIETVKIKNNNGWDAGNNGGSALQQLENIAGRKISTSSTSTRTVTNAAVRTISTNAMIQNTMKMELASGIASAFIGMLFSNNSQSNAQAIEAQRQQAAILAAKAEAERRYNDSIAQVKYEKMMKDYKLLNDPNGLQIKTLSAGGIQFKSLDMQPAPLTMEERMRQNLLKKGVNLTWDSKEWANISPNSNKIEEINTTETSDADKYLTAAIDKIETFQGGCIAALAGRYMLNIKKETMSYLKDASDAAISGNIARMDEVGNVDLRARISSNALYKTGVQTAKAYVEQGKDFVSGEINGARDDVNFGLMKSGGQEMLASYKIYAPVSDAWKVSLRKY